MDGKTRMKFKRLLQSEKDRILTNARNAIKHELNISKDDLADETDLAASELQQNLMFRLRDRERQMLSKLELALERIEDGSFGTCEECEEAIEKRRLEARPVSTLCLSCKEREERREQVYA